MRVDLDPKELADALRSRSDCQVQVGAVIVDEKGRAIAWGWNSPGDGEGKCAEEMAISRCNPKRRAGASIYISSRRRKSNNDVISKPCESCARQLKAAGLRYAYFRDEVYNYDGPGNSWKKTGRIDWKQKVINYWL